MNTTDIYQRPVEFEGLTDAHPEPSAARRRRLATVSAWSRSSPWSPQLAIAPSRSLSGPHGPQSPEPSRRPATRRCLIPTHRNRSLEEAWNNSPSSPS